ncbi:hypothetical protein BTVI_91479 [Pitangus sulphuratus]|nr:hypothetical protein BTVI_91479 [Pitangus sulphuratus]
MDSWKQTWNSIGISNSPNSLDTETLEMVQPWQSSIPVVSQDFSVPALTFLANLVSLYDRVTHLVDEGKTVAVVYLDFSKAFDTVSHIILLEKLAVHSLDVCMLQVIMKCRLGPADWQLLQNAAMIKAGAEYKIYLWRKVNSYILFEVDPSIANHDLMQINEKPHFAGVFHMGLLTDFQQCFRQRDVQQLSGETFRTEYSGEVMKFQIPTLLASSLFSVHVSGEDTEEDAGMLKTSEK